MRYVKFYQFAIPSLASFDSILICYWHCIDRHIFFDDVIGVNFFSESGRHTINPI